MVSVIPIIGGCVYFTNYNTMIFKVIEFRAKSVAGPASETQSGNFPNCPIVTLAIWESPAETSALSLESTLLGNFPVREFSRSYRTGSVFSPLYTEPFCSARQHVGGRFLLYFLFRHLLRDKPSH